jgi:arginyl-tRNA synthetase
MNIRQFIQSDIEKSIKSLGWELPKPVEVSYSSHPQFGDYTSSWPLQVTSDLSQSPMEIAKKIETSLKKSEVYETPQVVEPGFINFRLQPEFLATHLRLAAAEGAKFGSSDLGQGRKALIEFSSPNIAKPMHIGHLRNTNIGQALANILKFSGYQTVTDNHIGDWGTQFGQLIWAYKNWGQELENPTVDDLLHLYVRFHNEAATTPEMEDAARAEFKKLEQGDKDNRQLWNSIKSISLRYFDSLYRELGVRFDLSQGESFYEADLSKTVDQALKSGVATKDPDRSVIIPLEGMPPFLILKSDGATLYGTRDLATAKHRIEKIKPDLVLYVVGAEQSLYLRQLFAAIAKLGWGHGIRWVHVSYGLTRLAEGKMSTRAGELITIEEILTEARKKAGEVLNQKESTQTTNDLINQIAIGAIKWNDLKVGRDSEIIFDWGQAFNLDGNTGPYMQYSYARTQSILAKSSLAESKFDPMLLTDPSEETILRQLVKFPEVVADAADRLAPHLIATFAYELAQNFSRFYEQSPVLAAEADLRVARLGLVRVVGEVIKTSLSLLGIPTPNRL